MSRPNPPQLNTNEQRVGVPTSEELIAWQEQLQRLVVRGRDGIRLVVCMDFDTGDLKEAYRCLQIKMQRGDSTVEGFLGWETSDEWYREGEDGPQSEDELRRAIVSVLDAEEEEY